MCQYIDVIQNISNLWKLGIFLDNHRYAEDVPECPCYVLAVPRTFYGQMGLCGKVLFQIMERVMNGFILSRYLKANCWSTENELENSLAAGDRWK